MGVFDKNIAKLPAPKYTYINKLADAKAALDYINQFDMIEVDTEGTSLSPFDGKLVLLQLGVQGQPFVFDVRKDIGKSEFDVLLFKDLLEDKTKLKVLQNALYDVKMIKHHYSFYINNIYDTMLTEQLLNLGRPYVRSSLSVLVQKYLGLSMDKEPRGTFSDYEQEFQKYQLEYAALDVCTLGVIRDAQLLSVAKHKLERVCQLEFDFVKPMAEMELNGITINTERWLSIMQEVAKKKEELHVQITKILDATENQSTLFGVSLINIDSPKQLKEALKKYGVEVEGTAVDELEKYAGVPVIDNILAYRKAEKLISTYGQPLLDKIHPATGRLHTDFKQLIQTGRLSSSHPNLQNIPGKQIYRSCFIAKEGCALITADMSGAELRIIGNMSQDPVFVSCYLEGIDLHTKSAAGVFNVEYDKVSKEQRKASKAITFGLAYGLSKFGLARRLKISEKKAERLMLNYFTMFPKIKQWLEDLSNEAVRKGYSETIIGRRRFYDIPKYDSPDRKFIINGVKRQAKNAPIQGSNADTIKQAMIFLVERLEVLPYYVKLLLTVHDELIVECDYEHRYEVAKIVEQAIKDGFNMYFKIIPMETDALISACWMKGTCDKDKGGCGGQEFKFADGGKYGQRLVCSNCDKEQ
ncbi:MAG TPA: DNA polymerase [Patescibacteria group bacterium]|nr:DNA polymerase [Patescibacteria group bacterium]